MKNLKRIFILGTSGSGKTTLAKQISKKLKIKNYDLDDIFFIRKFDKKRTEKSRNKLFSKLIKKRKWIIEGVYSDWIENGIIKSDLVILLDVPFRKTAYRVYKRFRSRTGKYKETWKDFFNLLKFIKRYKKKNNPKGYNLHKKLIDKHRVNFIKIKNNKQLNDFLDGLSAHNF